MFPVVWAPDVERSVAVNDSHHSELVVSAFEGARP